MNVKCNVLIGCAGLMLLTQIAHAAPATYAACHPENDSVTLSGTIAIATATSIHTERPYSYPLLKLDKPVCYHDAVMGDVPMAQVVALIPDKTTLHQFEGLAGRGITVTGLLSRSVTGDQPPQDLLLFEATLMSKSTQKAAKQ